MMVNGQMSTSTGKKDPGSLFVLDFHGLECYFFILIQYWNMFYHSQMIQDLGDSLREVCDKCVIRPKTTNVTRGREMLGKEVDLLHKILFNVVQAKEHI